MPHSLAQRSQRWLDHLDKDALHWLDGLHTRLGNYGTTHEHLEGLLEGLGNALYDAQKHLEHDDPKRAERAKKQLEQLLDTLKNLAVLANISPPEEE